MTDRDVIAIDQDPLGKQGWRAHFSLWCVIAAPLIAGNDVRKMTPEVHAIMTDRDVIAIDQDPLGKQGWRALADPSRNIELWIKQLSDGEWAVCALNTADHAADLTIKWEYLEWQLKGHYTLKDLWNKKSAGDTKTPKNGRLESHDVARYRLTPLKP